MIQAMELPLIWLPPRSSPKLPPTAPCSLPPLPPPPLLQVVPVFEGLSGGAGSLIKYNPLSNITSAECWNFLRVMVSCPAELR